MVFFGSWMALSPLLLSADRVAEDPKGVSTGAEKNQTSQLLGIHRAMQMAAQQPQVQMADKSLQLAQLQKEQLSAQLRPQLNAVTQGYGSWNDSRLPSGQHAKGLQYGLQLNQSLYNDGLLSSKRAMGHRAESKVWELESSRLQSMSALAQIYVSLLKVDELTSIENDHLKLTDKLLGLARSRQSLGAAEASEVYRWEQNLALAKVNLRQLSLNRRQYQIQFNRLLGVNSERQWTLLNLERLKENLAFWKPLKALLYHEAGLSSSGVGFLLDLLEKRSLVTKSVDERLRAQQVQLGYSSRSLRRPTLSMSAEWTQAHEEGLGSSWSERQDARVQMQMHWPLYEGGGRVLERETERLVLEQLLDEREHAMRAVKEQGLLQAEAWLSSLDRTSLSLEALKAAEKTYVSVEDKYKQGISSVLDLLDAQEAMLNAQRQVVNSKFSDVSTFFHLQEILAIAECQMEASERSELLETLSSSSTSSRP